MESLNLDFLRSATEAGYGPVFRNDRYNLAVVQIEGSFTGLSLILEGRTDIDTGPWETVAGWSVTTPDTKTETVSSAGIYEWRIEGIREFRFRILAIESGTVNASGVLYNSADNSTYPYASAPGSITFGDPALFVKGICEQIFFDPSTGNIVGYDNTATDGSVTISVNLSEIAGGMGNRLIGVLPDTARISGGYTSSAFSLETREKIMGGQIAYNAVVQVCETVTADENGNLTVSRSPAPFFGEEISERHMVHTIRNKNTASFSDGIPGEQILDLKVYVALDQTLSGTPSPTNIRPIFPTLDCTVYQEILKPDGSTGRRIKRIGISDSQHPTFEGTLDVTNGVFTTNTVFLELTGDEDWQKFEIDNPYFYLTLGEYGSVINNSGICSHFPAEFISQTNTTLGQRIVNSARGEARLVIRPEGYETLTVEGFRAWLKAQAADLPVQIAYKETKERYINTTGAEFTVSAGLNQFSASTGPIVALSYTSVETTSDPTGCRCYIRKADGEAINGTAYSVNSETRMVSDFAAQAGESYEITYFTHNVSAQMLPIPSIWNPVMMTVQERYGVYAKQNGSAEKGVLKGWLYFVVPRAILNADAGESASETANATTDGSWIAIPEKPENMPFCDCDESAHPVAYYVYVPCSDENDAVTEVVSVGSGLTLKAGRTAQLPIKLVMPDDTLIQPDFTRMGYYSEDEAVATVDNRGIVTAVSEGQTVVHAFISKSDGSSLDSRTIVAVEGTRTVLTANRNNILVG